MDAIWKSMIEAYMSQLYNGAPEGALLESVKKFEQKFIALADEHEGDMDIAGIMQETGMQDEYTQLFMAVTSGNNDYALPDDGDRPEAFDYSQEQRLPSVHEFLDSYRVVYESVRPQNNEAVNKAYEALFEVENRTGDLIEAQIIIEKEHLILDTVTAGYRDVIKEFMDAADPNYEITSATVRATLGNYITAKSIDEITYMGDVARSVTADLAVQAQIKMSAMTIFTALIFGWEDNKKKIREGGPGCAKYAESMVLGRQKIRDYYRFLSEDMGITFDLMESRPFYRILMLTPTSLDVLCRIKKVMHPENIRAIKYVLFEEVLADKSMEEILLTPQKEPYYEEIDTNLYPETDAEFAALAEELNKDIPYFQKNRRAGMMDGNTELVSRVSELSGMIADPQHKSTGASGRSIAGGSQAADIKTAGKSLLRGLFRK